MRVIWSGGERASDDLKGVSCISLVRVIWSGQERVSERGFFHLFGESDLVGVKRE